MLSLKKTVDAAASQGPSELKHIDYLDGWRGLAIALVLEEHFVGLLPIDSGRLGVDIFFCLSGLLMSRILFIQRVSLDIFYKRRISRILPVFGIFVIAVYLFALLTGNAGTWTEFATTVAFLRTYLPEQPDIWHSTVSIGHVWSLNAEEHCYIFLSILTLVKTFRNQEAYVLISSGVVTIIIGLIYAKYPWVAPPWGSLGTEVVASHLLLSAGYSLLRDRVAHFISGWMPLGTLCLAVVCYSNMLPWWGHILIAPFLLAFSINHLPEAPRWFHALLASPPLRIIGIWSFSIYLWQQPFYVQKGHLFGGSSVALILAILFGLLSFYFLEKPIRTWLNKNW